MASKQPKTRNIIAYEEFSKILEDILLGLSCTGIKSLTRYQQEAVYDFICGRDTFLVLPTGHGKSFVYQMALMIAKQIKLNNDPIIVIVSPLNALIADQIKGCKRFGIQGYKLESSNIETLQSRCKYDVLFSSPEILESFPAKILLQKLDSRIIGLVVDESHCVEKW